MIFVTVGHQTPFDRLVSTVDLVAHRRGYHCLAQIGHGSYIPRHMSHERFLSQADFRSAMSQCRLVVAHAGIGSIVDALELGRRIVVLPRRSDLQETRNDHQIATVERFGDRPGVHVAASESDIDTAIAEALSAPPIAAGALVAAPSLIARVQRFVQEGQ